MGGKIVNNEAREEVYDMCARLGFWNVHPLSVAKDLCKKGHTGMSHQNVSRWKKQWLKKNGDPQVKKFAKELNANSQALLGELMKLAKTGTDKIRIEAARVFFMGQEKYTGFLESYRFKEKVAEPESVVKLSLADAYAEVMKEKKGEKK